MSDTNKNDGGPAFPCPSDDAYTRDMTGMSLRDYFAGQALAGLCSNCGGPYQSNPSNGWSLTNCTIMSVTLECYDLADAMLKARDQQNG